MAEGVVDPGVVTVALLYRIANRLEKIEKNLSEQLPLGRVLNIPDGLSITGDTYVYFLKGYVMLPGNAVQDIPEYGRALFSISIENEGPDNCVVVINPGETWGKRTVDSGETFELDMKKAVIREVKLSVIKSKGK